MPVTGMAEHDDAFEVEFAAQRFDVVCQHVEFEIGIGERLGRAAKAAMAGENQSQTLAQ